MFQGNVAPAPLSPEGDEGGEPLVPLPPEVPFPLPDVELLGIVELLRPEPYVDLSSAATGVGEDVDEAETLSAMLLPLDWEAARVAAKRARTAETRMLTSGLRLGFGGCGGAREARR